MTFSTKLPAVTTEGWMPISCHRGVKRQLSEPRLLGTAVARNRRAGPVASLTLHGLDSLCLAALTWNAQRPVRALPTNAPPPHRRVWLATPPSPSLAPPSVRRHPAPIPDSNFKTLEAKGEGTPCAFPPPTRDAPK